MGSNSPTTLSRLFLCAAFISAISYTAWPSTAAAIFDDHVLKNDVLGSFLVFSKFDIRQDRVTELRIVNNGDNLPDITGNIPDLRVRLNYVCPGAAPLVQSIP